MFFKKIFTKKMRSGGLIRVQTQHGTLCLSWIQNLTRFPTLFHNKYLTGSHAEIEGIQL